MFAPVLRQRRRVALVLLLTQLGVFVMGHGVAAIAYAGLLVMSLSIVMIIALPDMRRWLECGALAFVLCSWMPPVFLLGSWIVMTVVVHKLIYEETLDATPLRLTVECRRQYLSKHNVRLTWRAMVPGQGDASEHWSGALIDFAYDEDDRDTAYMRFRLPSGMMEEMTLNMVAFSPLQWARFMLERDSDMAGELMVMAYAFTDVQGGTRVTTTMTTEGLPLRLALVRWLDDTYGDEMEEYATLLKSQRKWSFVWEKHSSIGVARS